MNIAQVNHSDIVGGAARAAYRIHHAVRRLGVDCNMYVTLTTAGDWTVQGPVSTLNKAWTVLRGPLGRLPTKLFGTGNYVTHSPAILPSIWRKRLDNSPANVVHLHWVNGEMLSIVDIGHLRKPVVWTLHDMWAFCGAEHYTEDFRWRDGYMRHNRPAQETGFDLNRWTWQRKRHAWKHPMQIVTPSRWLARCVRQSVLMHDWPVTVIPNTIDTAVWQPVDKALARQLLALPPDVPLLLFGAMGGAKDPRKGFDLLKSALDHLRGHMPGLELIVFGQLAPKSTDGLAFRAHYTGHLHDDVSLRLLYSAADAMVIPSRQDNLPNTGLEALACGTPVVAFNICGLPDIVEHEKTGYLAKSFDVTDLATGLHWVLGSPDRGASLGHACRDQALRLWSYEVVAPQYLDIYDQAIKTQA